VAQAQQHAEQIVAAARRRAEELIAAETVVIRSRLRAADLVEAATVEASRLMRDADDYCDRRLAALEVEMERALAQIRRGRLRLQERRDDAACLVAAEVAGATALDLDAETGAQHSGVRSPAAARHASAGERAARDGADPGRVLDLTALERGEVAAAPTGRS